jgi:hypothetical protein
VLELLLRWTEKIRKVKRLAALQMRYLVVLWGVRAVQAGRAELGGKSRRVVLVAASSRYSTGVSTGSNGKHGSWSRQVVCAACRTKAQRGGLNWTTTGKRRGDRGGRSGGTKSCSSLDAFV